MDLVKVEDWTKFNSFLQVWACDLAALVSLDVLPHSDHCFPVGVIANQMLHKNNRLTMTLAEFLFPDSHPSIPLFLFLFLVHGAHVYLPHMLSFSLSLLAQSPKPEA